MRALKILGLIVGALVALIVVALLAVWLLVNPNDYKGRIAQAVKSSTGRDLQLPGDLKLSVFPWIALELGPASLGNPPGFGTEPFAQVQRVSFRVRLLPLLRKRLEVGRIEIDGLDLRLHKNAQGKGNWQDFGGGSESQSSAPASSGADAGILQDLGGVAIKDGKVSFEDTAIDQLNVTIGHVSAGAAVPVDLSLRIKTSGTAPPVEWRFAEPALVLDLKAQTLSAPGFTNQLAGATLSGSVQGRSILDAPAFSGSFKLEPVSVRDLMGRLGMTAPATRDPKVLSRLAASGDFAYGDNALKATRLSVQLDDSTLSGEAAITNLDSKAMSFKLALDRMNIDRYLSPKSAAAGKGSAPPPPRPQASGEDSLKTLQMNGSFVLGSATVLGLNVTDLHLNFAAKDGVTHISPASAKLYGGEYAGDITVDDRGTTPVLRLEQRLTGVDMARLLQDFAKTKRFSGRGTVTTNLTARGRASDEITKSLNGHVAAELTDGALEGIDLWFEIDRVVALVQKQGLPSGTSSGRTRFDVFKASAEVTDGVASTNDLNITSQNLRVTGQGTANLVSEELNYRVKATFLRQAPAGSASGAPLADIPLTITGSLASPKVRPDLEGMARSRVQQEIDKRKGELKQKLQDQLKGLFK